ncbi:MAG: hypothetical protein ACP5MV_03705 [Candidatus Parvarchaeum sp.]
MKNFNGDALGILFVIIIPAVVGYLFSIANLYVEIVVAVFLFIVFLVAAIRIVNQWNRKAALSFGKYVGIMEHTNTFCTDYSNNFGFACNKYYFQGGEDAYKR